MLVPCSRFGPPSQIFFDGLNERLWKGFNQGKLFEDLPAAVAARAKTGKD